MPAASTISPSYRLHSFQTAVATIHRAPLQMYVCCASPPALSAGASFARIPLFVATICATDRSPWSLSDRIFSLFRTHSSLCVEQRYSAFYSIRPLWAFGGLSTWSDVIQSAPSSVNLYVRSRVKTPRSAPSPAPCRTISSKTTASPKPLYARRPRLAAGPRSDVS